MVTVVIVLTRNHVFHFKETTGRSVSARIRHGRRPRGWWSAFKGHMWREAGVILVLTPPPAGFITEEQAV